MTILMVEEGLEIHTIKTRALLKLLKNPLIQGETAIMGVIANQKKIHINKNKDR